MNALFSKEESLELEVPRKSISKKAIGKLVTQHFKGLKMVSSPPVSCYS